MRITKHFAFISIIIVLLSFSKNDNNQQIKFNLVPYLKLNGKYIFVDSATMNPIFLKEYEECGLFNEGLAKVKINNRWGYINTQGDIVIPAIYQECKDIKGGIALVKMNNKWGGLNKNGTKVISFLYDWIEPFSNGITNVSKGINKNGFVNKNGKEIIPCKYNLISKNLENNFFALGFDNHALGFKNYKDELIYTYGFFNSRGKQLTNFIYNDTYGFSENLCAVSIGKRNTYKSYNGKWGFIDTTGKERIKLKYSQVRPFSEGLAGVQINQKWGFIDQYDKLVIPATYDFIWSFSEGLAAVEKTINGKNKIGFINKKGQLIINYLYEERGDLYFNEGICTIRLKISLDKYKLECIDKSGKIITKRYYDHIEPFSNGYAIVGIGEVYYGSDANEVFEGKYGLINKNGEESVMLKYDYMEYYNNLLYVTNENVNYFVDKHGREFKDAKSLKNSKKRITDDEYLN